MPLLGEATHPSFKVQLATPEPTGIRKDAEEKLEGAILNSGFVKNFCLAWGPPKKMDFFSPRPLAALRFQFPTLV